MKDKQEANEVGKEKRKQSGSDIDIWAIGTMVTDEEELARSLREHGMDAGVVNARFVKPLDTVLLA